MGKVSKYIPALGIRALTPLYDPLMRYVMREATLKRRLVEQAAIQERHRFWTSAAGQARLLS